MNRNPIIPFILIMVFGIGLTFFLSIKGLGDMEELAKDHEGEEQTEAPAEFDPANHYSQSCIGCHGQNYEGDFGPALTGIGDRLSKEEIKDVLVNGRGSMPGGLVSPDNADQMVEWLMTLE
jgi:cytochrome c550